MKSKVCCIIPARMDSKRFYGKPIARILGVPMVEHVYRRVQLAKEIDEVCVATCDKEIYEQVTAFGGRAVFTSAKHNRGTDRVAEAAKAIKADIIINVQGDEPLVDPSSLDKAIKFMKDNEQIQCVNLVAPITEWKNFIDPNVIKTVVDGQNRIMYFSRGAIPACKMENFKGAIKQIGIYFFRKELLIKYASWKETELEKKESIDMLRIMEKGYPIHAFLAKDMISVDTLEELRLMEKIMVQDALFHRIFPKKR